MSETIEALFDGKVFQPAEKVALKPNTRVKITWEPVENDVEEPKSFLRTARSLHLEGPVDWAKNLGDYLFRP